MAIRGIQNYLLLADAGVIEKPAILFGVTNPQMAIIAERIGLLSEIARHNPGKPAEAHQKMREMARLEVSGSFDEISRRAFSAETQRLEHLLARRLAAEKGAGEAALGSTNLPQ